jgi:hypothetical protein
LKKTAVNFFIFGLYYCHLSGIGYSQINDSRRENSFRIHEIIFKSNKKDWVEIHPTVLSCLDENPNCSVTSIGTRGKRIPLRKRNRICRMRLAFINATYLTFFSGTSIHNL